MMMSRTSNNITRSTAINFCFVYFFLLLDFEIFVHSATSNHRVHHSNRKSSSLSYKIETFFHSNSIGKKILKRYRQAQILSKLEQEVDDVNADWIACAPNFAISTTKRRLIVMPLDETFDPPMGIFSHGHVQTGDKMSLPKVFWQAINLNNAEVPWLFQVSRIDNEQVVEDGGDDTNKDKIKKTSGTSTGSRVQLRSELKKAKVSDDDEEEDEEDAEEEEIKNKEIIEPGAPPAMEPLDKVVGGPLDFRSPPNYVFLPWWMIRALGLKPRDVVDVELITTVPPGSLAKFRPLSSKTLQEITNPQAVLETELRHYSSLTKGSTIAFDYNKKRYWFEVAQVRSAPKGEKQSMIQVQDCDIATDFLPAKDTLKNRRNKK